MSNAATWRDMENRGVTDLVAGVNVLPFLSSVIYDELELSVSGWINQVSLKLEGETLTSWARSRNVDISYSYR